MSKSSILVVSEIFWPEGGGAERATQLIVELLAQYGFKVSVVTGTKNPVKIPAVEYYTTPYLRPSNRVTRWVLVKLLESNHDFLKLLKEHETLYIPLSAYPLIPLAKKRGLRVIIHLHNYMPIRYTGVKYYFEPDTLSIFDEIKLAVFHEFHVNRSFWRTLAFPISYMLYYLSKLWLTRTDRIICVSHRQAELILKNIPQVADKVVVLYNPMPRELLENRPIKDLDEKPTFIYMGGDSFLKGFHIVLKALKELGKQGIKARFVLANNYGIRSLETLKQLSKKYRDLEFQVVGRVKYVKLLEIYKKAWALLFPSICEEPLPYTVLEAVLLEVLPIASKVGGIVEVLKTIGGEDFMFEPGDINGFTSIIKEIIERGSSDVTTTAKRLKNSLLSLYRSYEHAIKTKLLEVFDL